MCSAGSRIQCRLWSGRKGFRYRSSWRRRRLEQGGGHPELAALLTHGLLVLLADVGVFGRVGNTMAALFHVGVAPDGFGGGSMRQPGLAGGDLEDAEDVLGHPKVLVEPVPCARRRADQAARHVVLPLHPIGLALLPGMGTQ